MTNRAPQILRRYSAVTLCVLASLFLAACGGGGETGGDGSRLGSTVPFSEKSSSGSQSDEPGTNEPERTASDDEGINTDSTTGDTTNDEVTDSGSTDDDSSSSSSSSSSVSNSGGDEETTDNDSLADSEESVMVEDGSVTLEWYRPDYRENGELIRDGEIGGYEVRYRQVGAQEAESVVLDGEWEVEYKLEGLEEGEYEFSIAAYDNNGLYSEFVSISPLQ